MIRIGDTNAIRDTWIQIKWEPHNEYQSRTERDVVAKKHIDFEGSTYRHCVERSRICKSHFQFLPNLVCKTLKSKQYQWICSSTKRRFSMVLNVIMMELEFDNSKCDKHIFEFQICVSLIMISNTTRNYLLPQWYRFRKNNITDNKPFKATIFFSIWWGNHFVLIQWVVVCHW